MGGGVRGVTSDVCIGTGVVTVGIVVMATLVCLSCLCTMADQYAKRTLYVPGSAPYMYTPRVMECVKQCAKYSGILAAAGVGVVGITGTIGLALKK